MQSHNRMKWIELASMLVLLLASTADADGQTPEPPNDSIQPILGTPVHLPNPRPLSPSNPVSEAAGSNVPLSGTSTAQEGSEHSSAPTSNDVPNAQKVPQGESTDAKEIMRDNAQTGVSNSPPVHATEESEVNSDHTKPVEITHGTSTSSPKIDLTTAVPLSSPPTITTTNTPKPSTLADSEYPFELQTSASSHIPVVLTKAPFEVDGGTGLNNVKSGAQDSKPKMSLASHIAQLKQQLFQSRADDDQEDENAGRADRIPILPEPLVRDSVTDASESTDIRAEKKLSLSQVIASSQTSKNEPSPIFTNSDDKEDLITTVSSRDSESSLITFPTIPDSIITPENSVTTIEDSGDHAFDQSENTKEITVSPEIKEKLITPPASSTRFATKPPVNGRSRSLPPSNNNSRPGQGGRLSSRAQLLERLKKLRERRLSTTRPNLAAKNTQLLKPANRTSINTPRNRRPNNRRKPLQRQRDNDFYSRLRNRIFTTSIPKRNETAISENQKVPVVSNSPTTKKPLTVRDRLNRFRSKNRFIPRGRKTTASISTSPHTTEASLPSVFTKDNEETNTEGTESDFDTIQTVVTPFSTTEHTPESKLQEIRQRLAAMQSSGGLKEATTTEQVLALLNDVTERPSFIDQVFSATTSPDLSDVFTETTFIPFFATEATDEEEITEDTPLHELLSTMVTDKKTSDAPRVIPFKTSKIEGPLTLATPGSVAHSIATGRLSTTSESAPVTKFFETSTVVPTEKGLSSPRKSLSEALRLGNMFKPRQPFSATEVKPKGTLFENNDESFTEPTLIPTEPVRQTTFRSFRRKESKVDESSIQALIAKLIAEGVITEAKTGDMNSATEIPQIENQATQTIFLPGKTEKVTDRPDKETILSSTEPFDYDDLLTTFIPLVSQGTTESILSKNRTDTLTTEGFVPTDPSVLRIMDTTEKFKKEINESQTEIPVTTESIISTKENSATNFNNFFGISSPSSSSSISTEPELHNSPVVSKEAIDSSDSIDHLQNLLRSFGSSSVRPELAAVNRVIGLSLFSPSRGGSVPVDTNLEEPELSRDYTYDDYDLETAATEQVFYTTELETFPFETQTSGYEEQSTDSSADAPGITVSENLIPTALNVDVTSLTVSEAPAKIQNFTEEDQFVNITSTPFGVTKTNEIKVVPNISDIVEQPEAVDNMSINESVITDAKEKSLVNTMVEESSVIVLQDEENSEMLDTVTENLDKVSNTEFDFKDTVGVENEESTVTPNREPEIETLPTLFGSTFIETPSDNTSNTLIGQEVVPISDVMLDKGSPTLILDDDEEKESVQGNNSQDHSFASVALHDIELPGKSTHVNIENTSFQATSIQSEVPTNDQLQGLQNKGLSTTAEHDDVERKPVHIPTIQSEIFTSDGSQNEGVLALAVNDDIQNKSAQISNTQANLFANDELQDEGEATSVIHDDVKNKSVQAVFSQADLTTTDVPEFQEFPTSSVNDAQNKVKRLPPSVVNDAIENKPLDTPTIQSELSTSDGPQDKELPISSGSDDTGNDSVQSSIIQPDLFISEGSQGKDSSTSVGNDDVENNPGKTSVTQESLFAQSEQQDKGLPISLINDDVENKSTKPLNIQVDDLFSNGELKPQESPAPASNDHIEGEGQSVIKTELFTSDALPDTQIPLSVTHEDAENESKQTSDIQTELFTLDGMKDREISAPVLKSSAEDKTVQTITIQDELFTGEVPHNEGAPVLVSHDDVENKPILAVSTQDEQLPGEALHDIESPVKVSHDKGEDESVQIFPEFTTLEPLVVSASDIIPQATPTNDMNFESRLPTFDLNEDEELTEIMTPVIGSQRQDSFPQNISGSSTDGIASLPIVSNESKKGTSVSNVESSSDGLPKAIVSGRPDLLLLQRNRESNDRRRQSSASLVPLRTSSISTDNIEHDKEIPSHPVQRKRITLSQLLSQKAAPDASKTHPVEETDIEENSFQKFLLNSNLHNAGISRNNPQSESTTRVIHQPTDVDIKESITETPIISTTTKAPDADDERKKKELALRRFLELNRQMLKTLRNGKEETSTPTSTTVSSVDDNKGKDITATPEGEFLNQPTLNVQQNVQHSQIKETTFLRPIPQPRFLNVTTIGSPQSSKTPQFSGNQAPPTRFKQGSTQLLLPSSNKSRSHATPTGRSHQPSDASRFLKNHQTSVHNPTRPNLHLPLVPRPTQHNVININSKNETSAKSPASLLVPFTHEPLMSASTTSAPVVISTQKTEEVTSSSSRPTTNRAQRLSTVVPTSPRPNRGSFTTLASLLQSKNPSTLRPGITTPTPKITTDFSEFTTQENEREVQTSPPETTLPYFAEDEEETTTQAVPLNLEPLTLPPMEEETTIPPMLNNEFSFIPESDITTEVSFDGNVAFESTRTFPTTTEDAIVSTIQPETRFKASKFLSRSSTTSTPSSTINFQDSTRNGAVESTTFRRSQNQNERNSVSNNSARSTLSNQSNRGSFTGQFKTPATLVSSSSFSGNVATNKEQESLNTAAPDTSFNFETTIAPFSSTLRQQNPTVPSSFGTVIPTAKPSILPVTINQDNIFFSEDEPPNPRGNKHFNAVAENNPVTPVPTASVTPKVILLALPVINSTAIQGFTTIAPNNEIANNLPRQVTRIPPSQILRHNTNSQDNVNRQAPASKPTSHLRNVFLASLPTGVRPQEQRTVRPTLPTSIPKTFPPLQQSIKEGVSIRAEKGIIQRNPARQQNRPQGSSNRQEFSAGGFLTTPSPLPPITQGLNGASVDNDPDQDHIPGEGGVDYPILDFIPQTSFKCTKSMSNGKMYADPETACQVYHVCNGIRKFSFLCPRGTIFHQETVVCQWWYTVDCLAQARKLAEVQAQDG